MSLHQRLHAKDNEEEQGLENYKSESKSQIYIPLFFIAHFLFFQKEANCLSNLHEKTRSLNYLVCILKICCLKNC